MGRLCNREIDRNQATNMVENASKHQGQTAWRLNLRRKSFFQNNLCDPTCQRAHNTTPPRYGDARRNAPVGRSAFPLHRNPLCHIGLRVMAKEFLAWHPHVVRENEAMPHTLGRLPIFELPILDMTG